MRRVLTIFLVGVWACQSSEPKTTPWPEPVLPEGVPAIPTVARNPTTVEGVALGRKLFFDGGLSANGRVSCMTCHRPGMAFTDGRALSRLGVSGNALLRHAPPLLNMAWGEGFFWDGGAADLESQAYGPLQHPDEMGKDLEELKRYLAQHPEYPPMFKAAFGDDAKIDDVEVARALAQYQRTLISFHSRWDAWQAGEGSLSELELQGWEVFQANCASCHEPPLFTDHGYHNNGLDASWPAGDEGIYQGRYRITLDSADMGAFKTPTLRNVTRTRPYMHDGRFKTIDEVLDHYSHGIQPSATLAPALENGISLNEEDRAALIAFLRTLTDQELPH